MHDEALTKEAAELLPMFQSFTDFYLVGGTALALQIGHRLSVDFDFFSNKRLPLGILAKTKRVFDRHSIAVTYKTPAEQLNIITNDVHVTFFHYPYPPIDRLASYKKIRLASIFEIALMKSFSIGKRLSYKDYVDWYFLLHGEHVSLIEVIAGAKKKFGGDFNDRLFLGQLASLEDIPEQKIDFLRESVNRKTIEKTLREAVKSLKL